MPVSLYSRAPSGGTTENYYLKHYNTIHLGKVVFGKLLFLHIMFLTVISNITLRISLEYCGILGVKCFQGF